MEHNLHDATKYFQVGQIAGTHALKGEVRVFPMTDDRERFTKGLELFYEGVRNEVFPLTVERSRQNGKFVLLKFKGLDSINDVERFRGGKLYVDRRDAIPLEEGEYFVADLVGMDVCTDDGAFLGTLTDVLKAVYAGKEIGDCENYGYADMFTAVITSYNGESTVKLHFSIDGTATGVIIDKETIVF